ncbi:MAG: lyase family protein, partial [cyanobacterium endosymbiont of Rhopalodia yunnanensis]
MTKPKKWSERFEGNLHPSIVRFNASISFDITGSIAHAKMLAHTGIIPESEAQQLVQGLEKIRQEHHNGEFTPGIDQEDVHFAVENRLTEIVGDVGKKLHTARSRNDQVGTDIRLYLRDQINQIRSQLRDCQQVFVDHAQNHGET